MWSSPTPLAILALAACSPGAGPAPLASLAPVALSLEGGAWVVGPERLVARLELPAALGERWIASNDNAGLVDLPGAPGAARALRFADGLIESSVRVLESFEGGAFDRVRLTLGARGVFRLRALAGREGRALESAVAEGYGRDEVDVQVFEIPFEALLAAEGTFTELALHLPYAESSVTIYSVELVKSGAAARLPSPLEEPRHTPVGSESRPAVGLVCGRTLAGAFAESPGARFAVEAALPDHEPAAGGELRIRLETAEGALVREELVSLAHAWSSHAVEVGNARRARLDALGGEELEVLIANARIERPVGEPRTVLLVTSDTHRADHLGSAAETGAPVQTPHLDALAAQGLLLADCFSQTNATNPSHVALMTGVHPRDTRIVSNRVRLGQRADTLAEAYASAGYRTFAVTSAFHLADATSGLGQGFERMDAPPIYDRGGDVSAAVALRWLEEAADQNVFLWLHVFDGHSPYAPPPPFDRRYYDPRRDPGDPARALDMFSGPLPLWLARMGVTDREFPVAQYRAEIDFLDAALGPVLALPRVREGVTAFTADHGESFGNHDVWFAHEGLYPDSLHVPLILRWPGGPAGERAERPVRMFDLGRALLDLSGLEAAPFPGESLLPGAPLAGSGRPRFALAAQGSAASVELDGWLLVMYLQPHVQGAGQRRYATGQTELFWRARDPECAQDRLLTELERAAALRATLIDWLCEASPLGPAGLAGEEPLDDAGKRMLAELGYGGDAAGGASWWDPRAVDPEWETSPWRRLFEDPTFGLEEFRAAVGR